MNLAIEWLPDDGPPEQLVLLLHGWGADGGSMAPLALALRREFPRAAVLAPDAPDAVGDDARRRQWYAVDGLDPANWPGRVAAALPPLQRWIHEQQRRLGVGTAATAIGGFSQGAVLALELAAVDDGIAGRVLAFGGCYASPPQAAPELTTVHLFHGDADDVIPADGSRQALAWLGEHRGDATIDIAAGIGHQLHPALVDCALHRLRSHIPLRTWRNAMGAAPPREGRGDPLDDD